MDISAKRKKIDVVDDKIIDLLSQRMETSVQIGKEKQKTNQQVYDEEREKQLLTRIKEQAKDNHLSSEFIEELYRLILAESKRVQK